MFFAVWVPVYAQQQAKLPKIGWLAVRPASAAFAIELFQREFSKLGYVDGKNIVFEYRYAEGKLDRSPPWLMSWSVSKSIDHRAQYARCRSRQEATKTIPIVFIDVTDPIAAGLVDSLPRPGGNITGFTTIGSVLAGKRLELLKEIIPKLSRVAVLGIHRMQAPRRVGKKANSQRENWACNLIPWTSAAPTNMKLRLNEQLRRAVALSSRWRARWDLRIKD